MAIWKRELKDRRTYFNTDTALIKNQQVDMRVKFCGITILKRVIDFDATDAKAKAPEVGFGKSN
jgi:hypothetical protein